MAALLHFKKLLRDVKACQRDGSLPCCCRGVSAFEEYITDNEIKEVSYEELSALYEDPTNLEVIKDPLLRMRARACINQVGGR